MYLIVSDIGAARDEFVARGVEASEVRSPQGAGVPSAVAPSSVLHPEVW